MAQAGTVGSYGTFAIDAAGAWTYTASSAHNEFEDGTTYTDTFAVASADGTTTSVTINILGTNDAAVLSADVRDLTETNAALATSGTLTISDVDSPASFVAQAGTAGSYGTFAIDTAGTWTYTASSQHNEFAAGTTYTDTFAVASADGTTTSVTINILGTNDAAVVSADVRDLSETNVALATSGTLTVSDVDSPASFVAQAGTAGSYGTFAIDAAGAWTYTASSEHNEFEDGTTYTDTFAVASADGTPSSVTINILGTNDAPVMANIIPDQTLGRDAFWSFQVPANTFFDADSALTLNATLGSGDPLPDWLTFADGTRTFSGTPPLGFSGSLQLRVTASDGTLNASDTFDLTVLASGSSDQPIVLSPNADTYIASDLGELINGMAGNDTITGGPGNDRINGNAGDDTLDGGSGIDILSGGAGNDTYFVNNTGDVVIENAGEGTDTVFSTVHYRLSENVESLVMQGNTDLQGYGNSDANTLYGNTGNNLLNGGAGADTMIGGAGNDAYFVDNAADAVIENAGQGTDTVYSTAHLRLLANVEHLVLQGGADLQGYGNDLTNAITGNSGNNILDGGAGADAMYGGAGNDAYFVDNAGDAVIENAGQGTDTVYSTAHLRLLANVEHLVLQGGADLQGYGNDLTNAITGNSGNNILDGGAGADAMYGGAGNDAYFVDNAGDAVIENAGRGYRYRLFDGSLAAGGERRTPGPARERGPAGLWQQRREHALRQRRQQFAQTAVPAPIRCLAGLETTCISSIMPAMQAIENAGRGQRCCFLYGSLQAGGKRGKSGPARECRLAGIRQQRREHALRQRRQQFAQRRSRRRHDVWWCW